MVIIFAVGLYKAVFVKSKLLKARSILDEINLSSFSRSRCGNLVRFLGIG